MSRSFRRVALVLALAACGNSGDGGGDTAATSTTAGAPGTTAPAPPGDRDAFVPIEGVPGVTDEAISYAAIGTRSNNPLGTCLLDCYVDGIEAYFAYRNSEGGIYGRELRLTEILDDELAQNQVRALEVVASDAVFGAFSATLLASGWGDLDGAGIPTYVWGIHGTEMSGRSNIFGHLAALCTTCTQRGVPYAALQAGATRVASLGYGVSENSRQCAQAVADSFERYTEDIGAEVVYVNDDLEFGLPNGIAPEVSAMKEAGVDFVSTCIDLNGMKTLAQELDRQGMQDVVLYHPNSYNQQFIADGAGLFEGDFVAAQFVPFESEGAAVLEEFFTWLDETGAEPSELAMIGWINADMAFESLLAAGPEFDRASVVAAMNQVTAYDAGGLINPIDWTRQHVQATEGDPANDYALECTPLVRVVDGAFETVGPPDKPWLCWSNETLDWSEPVPTSFG